MNEDTFSLRCIIRTDCLYFHHSSRDVFLFSYLGVKYWISFLMHLENPNTVISDEAFFMKYKRFFLLYTCAYYLHVGGLQLLAVYEHNPIIIDISKVDLRHYFGCLFRRHCVSPLKSLDDKQLEKSMLQCLCRVEHLMRYIFWC